MPESLTARRIVLNLTRVSAARCLPVRRLIEVGALFGFKEGAVRVAVTRLLADGLLETDGQGGYGMGPAAGALSTHVEQWRLGEARMRPWNGAWLAVAMGSGQSRRARRASLRALERLGMREGLAGLWLRPDNLAASLGELRGRLAALGLEDGAETFVCQGFGMLLDDRLRTRLWPLEAVRRGHEAALQALLESQERLAASPRDAALVESFLVGGEAIRVLATDPLLPEEIMPGESRRVLTERMLLYDQLGHRLWEEVAMGAEAGAPAGTATRLEQGARDVR